VVLGIRPEDVHIVSEREPGALRAAVYAVEPLGDRYIYDLQLGGYVIKVKAPPSCILEAGRPAWALFDPARVHLFNAGTNNRIDEAAHG
jgi:multiple sugar transport system ATP-binding protein